MIEKRRAAGVEFVPDKKGKLNVVDVLEQFPEIYSKLPEESKIEVAKQSYKKLE